MLDDDDLGTMMKIWWSTGSENPQPVELFAESANLEPVENDNIDDEGLEEVEDVHSPSFRNLSHGIVLRNEPRGDMLKVYPDAAHASEFLEYADIVPAYRLASNSQLEELFVRQQLKNKAGCVFAIKQYNIKLLIDYQVAKSTLTLYVREFWRTNDRCGWQVWAAFIHRTQQWKIRKLEWRHTCTVTCMSQDNRKLDAKRICNCIMPLVKDSLIILVSTLIADMQAQFQYRVSYRKAWWAKQMTM
ncbi:hypothetical protein PVK06_039732 [Gossypium arboreum]|uniref:Transposase MuDR plant domain-containing protein n=1 Tax=Gossypium arboreum TaxID=29729 RepID=A0ABR0N3P5_GOSAR|nr:hypothetical protein PVK06_039732 [Gossypium arboreum]